MVSIKVDRFSGIVPGVAPELLPDENGQGAVNVDLRSGQLEVTNGVQLRQALDIGNSRAKTLYGVRGADDVINWMAWTTDVDVVSLSSRGLQKGRVYYTEEGVLRTTLSDAGIAGAKDVGMPIPDAQISVILGSKEKNYVVAASRDESNIVTITTENPHGFTTGVTVTVFVPNLFFHTSDWRAKNVVVTVLSGNKFTYFSSGDGFTFDDSSAQDFSSGRSGAYAILTGTAFPRSYVYTFVGPNGEESLPSEATQIEYVEEGRAVALSEYPREYSTDRPNVAGIRMYRSASSLQNTGYLRLWTLWFPITGDISAYDDTRDRVVFTREHAFVKGDTGYFNYAPNASNGITVLEVDGANSILIKKVGDSFYSREFEFAVASGSVPPYVPSFNDNLLTASLSLALPSLDYDPPPPGLSGLKIAHDTIFIGFFGNTLCFSEPKLPHAWPEKYRVELDTDIVGLGGVHNYIIAFTQGGIYVVSGRDPANLAINNLGSSLVCTSKRSIVDTGAEVIWATWRGIATFSPDTGVALISETIPLTKVGVSAPQEYQDYDASVFDPKTTVAVYYNGAYRWSSDYSNGFVLRRRGEGRPELSTFDYKFSSTFVDDETGRLYFSTFFLGPLLHEFDGSLQTTDTVLSDQMYWKSKDFVLDKPTNMGALKIDARYYDDEQHQRRVLEAERVQERNRQIIADASVGGFVNGHELGLVDLNGPGYYLEPVPEADSPNPVQFTLFANKEPLFTVDVTSEKIVRLPHGYKAGTFSFSVSSKTRVRSIHLAETPYNLESV